MALALIALGMVRHVLRSRRFYEGLAVAAIAVGSMRGISQDSRAGAMARLAAWNKREVQRLEHKAERLEYKLEHKAERRPARLRTPPSEWRSGAAERRAWPGQQSGNDTRGAAAPRV